MREAGYEVAVTALDAPRLKDVGYDLFIDDAEVIEVGKLRLHAIHNPGHTEGSISFAVADTPLLFTGDTLFPGGPGNTALEGGDFDTIIRSIDNRLFTFPGNTVVLPGYTLVDLRASLPIGRRLELTARIENLFNAVYETALNFGQPGRAAYAGLRVTL